MSAGLARALRAYPTLLRVGFAAAVAYRAELIIWMLTTTMPLVSLALWTAVAESAPVGRFGARDFTAYFLITLIVRQLTNSWLVWEMNADIKSGALTQRLLKPMHPLLLYSADNLAAIPLRALLCVPVALVVLVASGERLPTEPRVLLLALAAMVGAWLLNFLVTALIGALAFVMESSTAVFEVYLAAFMIFAGYLVPLELFPPALRAVAAALPFRSLWILVIAAAFYVVRLDNLAYLLNSLFDFARWPVTIFKGFLRVVFTVVIPLGLMTTYPALALLGALSPRTAALTALGALVFAAVSRAVWLRSIGHYTSASS